MPWAVPYDEETVLTADQGLLALFRYSGIDAEGSPAELVDQAVNSFERAFLGFGSGTFTWHFVDRRKSEVYPSGDSSNPLGKFAEEEWANQTKSSQYVNHYSIGIFQRTNTGSMGFLDDMDRIVKEEGLGFGRAFFKALRTRLSVKHFQSLHTRTVKGAKEMLEQRVIELQTGMAGLGLTRLSGESLMAYLFNRVNVGSRPRNRLPMPTHLGQFLNNHLVIDTIERRSDCLEVSDGTTDGTKYVGVISLKGLPARTAPGQLDYLLAVNGEVTVAHCFMHIDSAVAEKEIESREKYFLQSAIPFVHRLLSYALNREPEASKLDSGKIALAADAIQAKQDMAGGNRAYGFNCTTILCFGSTKQEMEIVKEQVMRRLAQSSYTGRVERMHQLAAFTQTIPGSWQGSVRWLNVSHANASDMAPIRTLVSGPLDSEHLTKELGQGKQPVLISMPTDSGVPFNWDPFESGAGHTAFIGPTRNGKTALVSMLLSIFKKYPRNRVIRIDKDYSMKISTLLGGGMHIDLRGDDDGPGVRMCPIGLVNEKRNHIFLIGWVRRLLETLIGETLAPEEIEKVTNAISHLYTLPREMHTLSHLSTSLGPSLAKHLADWIKGGGHGGWFDNPPVDMSIGDDVCFEMKRLMSDEIVADFAMDYIFYLIERSIDGRPTIVNFEEAWFFLARGRFADRMEDYARTFGKNNIALWITTQSAIELTRTDQLLAIVDQIKNFCFLPNARIMSNPEGYAQLGLTDAHLRRICAAQPKQDYYFKTENLVRMCTVRIPPALIPTVQASPSALAMLERHRNSGREDWADDYYAEFIRRAESTEYQLSVSE